MVHLRRVQSFALVIAAAWTVLWPTYARAQQSLTQLQFDIVGVRLEVDPAVLTVPKNIATQINTRLALPAGAGPEAQQALATLSAGATVEAQLHGPGFSPPTHISVLPGQPIPLPGFAIPGEYFLDQIKLVRNGVDLLGASDTNAHPVSVIPITVIADILITSVTSRPLTLDEIRARGVVIDDKNFQVRNFQAAFNIEGVPFKIDLPVAFPTRDLLSFQPDRAEVLKQVALVNQTLAGTQTVTLPPQFDRPGLNFYIAPLPFVPVTPQDDEALAFGPPPITALVVIQGNIGFLNQHFAVKVMVANAAPDGTPLSLRDITSTIELPKGLDRVAGTFDHPGDDPLRLARIENVGQQPTIPVMSAGPDGVQGTADDRSLLLPQGSGAAEHVVEALQEGFHTVDLAIDAVLDGLPSGPVRLKGAAQGAVFVRNPTFSIALSQPRTVQAGQQFDLFATVTNTSQTIANLLTISLHPFSISGAQLVGDPTVTFDSLPPGQSVTARFTLVSQQTGQVTFASFNADSGVTGSISLRMGIGERGVPIAPNIIMLPKTTDFLPAGLVTAAERVLGQALNIATAPADLLPASVLYVKKQTVQDRAIELAEAGQRVQFGESLDRVLASVGLDWFGNRSMDDGFDQLLRTTDAGAAFRAELAKAFNATVQSSNVLDFQQAFAQSTVTAPGHLSAIAGSGSGGAPVLLRMLDAAGQTVGVDDEGVQQGLPGAALLTLQDGAARSDFALVAHPNSTQYTVEAAATADATFDLGVVLPAGPGQLLQLRYPGVHLLMGGLARVLIDLSAPGSFGLIVDRDGDGNADDTIQPVASPVVEGPPQVLAVRQLETSFFDAPGDMEDPATYGLLTAVLFDRPVTEASSETKTNYAVDSNAVVGAQLQASARLVYLYLQKPIGVYVPRTMTVSGVTDTRGNVLPSTSMPIQTVMSEGGHVFGHVQTATGQAVPNAVLSLTVEFGEKSFLVTTVQADREGAFDFDYVTRRGDRFVILAQHPVTRQLAQASARVRALGEMLLINATFRGRGTARGRVLIADGDLVTPVAGASVFLTPSTFVDFVAGIGATTDAFGQFVITDVPVGPYNVRAIDATGAFGQASGLVPQADGEGVTDIVLVHKRQDAGRLVGRVFLSDGSTPAASFPVYVGFLDRQDPTHPSISAAGQTTTDSLGNFEFDSVLAGSYDVVAVDPATGQLGVTHTTLLPVITTSTSIVMEATGNVEGIVYNAQGHPLAGALVAGGISLATTDANGFFRITGVPAGKRTIEAGDPVTKRRGRAAVSIFSGQTSQVAITLEARATIVGRVLDANGTPVPKATVRLPTPDGFTFVFANNAGIYTFPDLPLGDYLIEAPGPSQDGLIEFMRRLGLDPATAFTSGDCPPTVCEPMPEPDFSDENAALRAYQNALQVFFGVDDPLLTGPPPPPAGGFGWTKVRLFQDSVTVTNDVKYLAQGSVSGKTVDGNGLPTGATVRVSSMNADPATGLPKFQELHRLTTDPVTGTFAFDGIARFDLATFQTTGIRSGDFTLEAANPFSPTVVSFRSQLNVNTPNETGIVLQFPAAAETNGTITGHVFMPDGTPAPAGVSVKISYGDLTVTTDANGRFENLFPIPGGNYTLTAQHPLGGLKGQAIARVPAGGNVDVQITLLGLGAVTVTVKRPDGQLVNNAIVVLQRGTFPKDTAQGTTTNGVVHFANISEGPFSVRAEELITGLVGRASGAIVRNTDVSQTVVIIASGQVTGTFVGPDATTPIPNAQIVLTAHSGVHAFAPTDNQGRFTLTAIPVGTFTVEASDPLTGRVGRATGNLAFEGQTTDVVVIEVPRGSVEGFVLQNDGVTSVPGAAVSLHGSAFGAVPLQASTRSDGGFRFEGVAAGTFTLQASDPQSHATGSSTGSLTMEGETVTQNVVMPGIASLHVRVFDSSGQPAGNATIDVSGVKLASARHGSTDANGEATFDFLPLGKYHIVARSLANSHDGGVADSELTAFGQTAEALVNLRGTGDVAVTVLASDGMTTVPGARVTLTAQAAVFGDTFIAFTDSSGVASILGVPVGGFFVKGESGPLAGLSTGTVDAAGAHAEVTVQLGASGSIAGRILLPPPAELTPAFQAFVTLTFQPQSSLQSGVLQITTPLDGTFEFSGIPIGPFKVSAFEEVSNGVRTIAGSIGADGQQVQLGDIVLDNEAPHVDAVSPADRSTDVAVTSPFVLTFNEPMQPSSFNASAQSALANIFVLEGSTKIPGSISFSNGNRTVSFTPMSPLKSSTLYTVVVAAAPTGPRDESNLQMLDPFVSSFTSVDILPPVVISVSPAANARQVQPDAAIRVAFSEPIAPGIVMSLTDQNNQPIAGQLALTLANTVAILSPTSYLQPNNTYTVHVSNVSDASGNALAGGVFSSTFFTADTVAPGLGPLQIVQAPTHQVAGSTLRIQPAFTSTDVARVEYQPGAAAALFATVAPFFTDVVLPSGQPSVQVTAVAVDFVGNRSAPATLVLPIETDLPPTVTLVNSSGATTARQGDTLAFQITADDDIGLATVTLTSVGDVRQTNSRTVPSGQTHYSFQQSVAVPASAPSNGSFVVQASTIDTGGNRASSGSVTLRIRDGVAPIVSITSPVSNARVLPGQPVAVAITVSDDVGVATIELGCTPALTGCTSRALGGAQTSMQDFSIQVPPTGAGPITLRVTATDTSGNQTTVSRVIQAVDTVAPMTTSLATLTGTTQVPRGSVTVRAHATDNVAVTSVQFRIPGLAIPLQTVTLTQPATDVAADLTFTIAPGTPAGTAFTVFAKAIDGGGNQGNEVSLNLEVTGAAPQNHPPTANAGPDQNVALGATVHLNGTASSDPDGDTPTYQWSFASQPAGSTATLADPSAAQPTFVADRAGAYILDLVVSDGIASSAPDEVIIVTLNTTPVANAGADQTIATPQVVTLDGSHSSDADGDALTFTWSFVSRPAGSSAALSDPAAVSPTFLADIPGIYNLRLVVNDGKTNSAASTVRVSTQNSRPVANAGADQSVAVGSLVHLNGSASSDVDGDPLTFAWSFVSVAPGSAATLIDATTATPTFLVDLAGTYVVQLVANDGMLNSVADTVSITTQNSPPVANAGPDQTVAAGSLVQLDGSGSTDVDGDGLSFQWSFTSVPAGSAAIISDPTAVKPTFTIDVKGTYVAQLIVNDGTVNSAADTVLITTANSAPIANAGTNQTVAIGSTVFVDAGGSSDPDGDSLAHQWSIIQKPAGSNAQLATTNTFATSFVADVAGSYIVQLIVNDGFVSSAPTTVTIATGNVAPVASAGTDQIVTLGQTVHLDGTGSSDANGDALTYSWSFVSRPPGSTATLSSTTLVSPTFVADRFGTYVAQLIVSDGTLFSAPDTVSITVQTGTIALALVGTPLVGAGSSAALAITISPAAPAGGVSVAVSSDNTSILTVGPPATATVPQGGTTATVTINAITAGTTIVRANAPGYAEGSLTIGGTPNIISVPQAITLAPGQDISLPISIAPAPAPPEGLVIGVSSSDPSHVEVVTPTVIVPPGAVSVNATLRGKGIGASTLTATNAAYASGITQATTTASLNIVQATATFSAGFTSNITVQLQNGAAAVAAPSPGVSVTLTPDNPACVSVTSPVVIGTGVTSVVATLSYGGTATLPCSTTVTAGSADLASDTIAVTVNTQAGITLFGFPATVGAGLQATGFTARLGTAQHGGVTMHLESSVPGAALLAPDFATPATASLDVALPNGSTDVTFVVAGVEDAAVPATVTITATATGFTNGTGTATIVQPGLQLAGLATSTTSLSADDPFEVQVGVPNAAHTVLALVQAVRAGAGSLTATITHSNANAAQLVTTSLTAQTVTTAIAPGQNSSGASVASGGVAFHPKSPGQTTVSASIPGFTAMANASSLVTITGPAVTLFGFPTTVGAGLQATGFTARLGASQHGGVTMHIASSNSALALVAPNATSAGAASIDVAVANGFTDVTFVVQGIEGAAGSATITASATGFTDVSGSATIVQPALRLSGVPTSTTSASAEDPFQVQVGIPTANQSTLAAVQAVRIGGAALSVTVTHSNPLAAQLHTTAVTGQTVTVNIAAGQSISPVTVATGGVAFHPLAAGQTTVSAAISGFIATTDAASTVTVIGPGITLLSMPSAVGAGLQSATVTARLGASQHGGVTVRVQSADPAVALISPNATTVGSTFIDVAVANGSTDVAFIIQSLAGVALPATASVTVSAPGFSSVTGSTPIVQPAVQIQGNTLAATTTALSADDPFQLQVGVPNAGQTALALTQAARVGGGSLTATVTHTNPAIAQLVTSGTTAQTVTVTIAAGQSSSPASVAAGGVSFNPLAAGSTTVSATIPGFISTTNASAAITINAPGITFTSLPATVGAGLQAAGFVARLGATQHGGVTMHVTSSNGSVALVSPNATTAGTTSIDVAVPNGSTDVPFVIHGVEGAPVPSTVTITASAPGFTNGSGTATIVQPALRIVSLATSMTASAADDPFQVQIGIPNANATTLASVQSLRIGASPLTVTVTNTNAAAARLKTTPVTGQSVTVTIVAGQSASPATVAAGGVALDPLAAGQTTVSASAPGYVATTAASVAVTISP